MLGVVSPYHLTTREAPVAAAVLLAGTVLTFVPAPGQATTGREALTATRANAAYHEFVRSWSWCVPLWSRGLLTGASDGLSPREDLAEVLARLRADESWAALRQFVHEGLEEDEARYLSLLSQDLLKGGPDPGLSLPVLAALDRFAGRCNAVVFRSQAVSVAQRAEAGLGRPMFSLAVPLLVQADAERVLLAREVLEPALRPLRAALLNAREAATVGRWSDALATGLANAAGAYARAFEARRAMFSEGARDDEVRMIESTVTVTGMVLPADAVLRSSSAAIAGGRARPAQPDEAGLVRVASADARPVLSLIVRPLGKR